MAAFKPQKTNPATLGFIKPTSGTPLQVTSNFTDLSIAYFQSLSIQAHTANTGKIFVLSSNAAADVVNGSNILAILAAGQSIPFNGWQLGGVTPAQFWIDTDVTGSIAIPTVYGA